MVNKEVSRRTLLRWMGFAAGAAVLTGLSTSCGATPTPQIVKETVVVPKEVTKEVVKEVTKETVKEVTKEVPKEVTKVVEKVVTPTAVPKVKATGPIRFYGWGYRKDIVDANLDSFKKANNEQVEFIEGVGDYHSYLETQLLGGQRVDMAYAEEFVVNRWWKAGFVQDVEFLPDAQALKKKMFASTRDALTNPEGKLMGLAYYAAHYLFCFNKEHLEKAKLAPPKTWDELIMQCEKLKKDGISKYPYVGRWMRPYWAIGQQFFSDLYSDGEPAFDEKFNPTFKDGGVAFQKVLERYRLLFEKELTPPGILTAPDDRAVFATGEHTFYTGEDYACATYADPKFSKIAGKVGYAMYPGTKGNSLAVSCGYLMGKQTVDEERVWKLMRHFGGQAADGKYYGPKDWLIKGGLGCPWPEVYEDPDVKKALEAQFDMNIYTKQWEKTTPRNVNKALWFREWDEYMRGQLQDFIMGKMKVGEIVKGLYDKAVDLRSKYPTF